MPHTTAAIEVIVCTVSMGAKASCPLATRISAKRHIPAAIGAVSRMTLGTCRVGDAGVRSAHGHYLSQRNRSPFTALQHRQMLVRRVGAVARALRLLERSRPEAQAELATVRFPQSPAAIFPRAALPVTGQRSIAPTLA